jgi:hypothetical protein
MTQVTIYGKSRGNTINRQSTGIFKNALVFYCKKPHLAASKPQKILTIATIYPAILWQNL